ARVGAAPAPMPALEPRHLLAGGERGARVLGQVQLMPRLVLPGADAPLVARDRDGTRGARGLLQRRQHDLVRVGKAGLLAGERPYPDALLDAGAAVLHDPVLERPGLLVRELEVQVREVDRVREHLPEYLVEASVIEPARAQDQLAREAQGVFFGNRTHELGIPSAKTRWPSAGKLSRTPDWRARSTSATAQPLPRGTRCRMRPQKSTIMLSP